MYQAPKVLASFNVNEVIGTAETFCFSSCFSPRPGVVYCVPNNHMGM